MLRRATLCHDTMQYVWREVMLQDTSQYQLMLRPYALPCASEVQDAATSDGEVEALWAAGALGGEAFFIIDIIIIIISSSFIVMIISSSSSGSSGGGSSSSSSCSVVIIMSIIASSICHHY